MADPVDTTKPAPNLDPDKVKAFQKGMFGSDSNGNPNTGSTLDAIKRRMSSWTGGGDSNG